MAKSGIGTGFRVAAALTLLWSASPARAEDPPAAKPPADPGHLTVVTERVVVFKDGYALFVKGAEGTADAEGRVYTESVPDAAVLGCVWAVTGKSDDKIVAMRSEWHESKETRTKETACITTLDILRANAGKNRLVTLGLTREKAADILGPLLEVLDLPPEAPADGRVFPPGETVNEVAPRGGQLVVIGSDHGPIVLPVAEIRTVSGQGLETKMARTENVTRRSKRLSFDFGRESAGKAVGLRLMYFGEGVRWIPTYRVGGALEKDAQIALQGEVLNEAEDIAGAAVDLVVGVPSFRFRDVTSSLTLERTMRGAIHAAAPQLAQQLRNSNFFSNAMGNDEAQVDVAEPGRGAGLEAAPELATSGEQDLFVYGIGRLTLAKGARATVPLWQLTAPLRHLYTMDVQVVRNQRSGEHSYQSTKSSVQPAARAGRTSASPVWHELELTNTSGAPWTTGSALLLKGYLPLGQDILTYTSPGARSLLPMTVAVDLRGKYEEKETERRSNALNWSNGTYSQVSKQGSVTITSYRKEASPIRVTISVGGLAENASDGGKIVVNDVHAEDWANGGFAVNNHSDVSWELTLEPGQSKTLTYAFSFYVQ